MVGLPGTVSLGQVVAVDGQHQAQKTDLAQQIQPALLTSPADDTLADSLGRKQRGGSFPVAEQLRVCQFTAEGGYVGLPDGELHSLASPLLEVFIEEVVEVVEHELFSRSCLSRDQECQRSSLTTRRSCAAYA